ncbi:HEAT repeat domain-containing protein [Planctomycetota bacterium]
MSTGQFVKPLTVTGLVNKPQPHIEPENNSEETGRLVFNGRIAILVISLVILMMPKLIGHANAQQAREVKAKDQEEKRSPNSDMEQRIDRLIDSLKSEDDAVFMDTARTLVRIGEPAVLPMIKALEDENVRVRRAAAFVLGKIADVRAVKPLTAMCTKEDDAYVRLEAAAAALVGMGILRLEPLLEMLDDKDANVVWNAARVLVEAGPPVVEPMIKKLEGENEKVRRMAAYVLGEVGDRKAVEVLTKVFEEDDSIYVRAVAAAALFKMGELKLERLVEALAEEDLESVHCATQALANIGAPAVDALIKVLNDENEQVRKCAAGALAMIGKPAVKPLIEALADTEVTWQAMLTLQKIGEPSVEPLINALGRENTTLRAGAVNALAFIGEPAVEPLIKALDDENEQVQRWALHVLGALGDERAVGPLVKALGSSNEEVQSFAVSFLSSPKSSVQRLLGRALAG